MVNDFFLQNASTLLFFGGHRRIFKEILKISRQQMDSMVRQN